MGDEGEWRTEVGGAGCLVSRVGVGWRADRWRSCNKLSTMSSLESESDDSQEFASIPTSPRVEYNSEHEGDDHNDNDGDETDDGSRGTRSNIEPKGKNKDTVKQDTFRVLVTGFGVCFVCYVGVAFAHAK